MRPVCRTPRRFANKVVPGRQMKPYRFSLLRDLHQGVEKNGFTRGSLVQFRAVMQLGPRPCNNNPRPRIILPSRPFPLCTATFLILSLYLCSLFSCHLLRFFARHRAYASLLVHICAKHRFLHFFRSRSFHKCYRN